MRYRVKFSFWGSPRMVYYTQWFETKEEAWGFITRSELRGDLFLHAIVDSDGTVI